MERVSFQLTALEVSVHDRLALLVLKSAKCYIMDHMAK